MAAAGVNDEGHFRGSWLSGVSSKGGKESEGGPRGSAGGGHVAKCIAENDGEERRARDWSAPNPG